MLPNIFVVCTKTIDESEITISIIEELIGKKLYYSSTSNKIFYRIDTYKKDYGYNNSRHVYEGEYNIYRVKKIYDSFDEFIIDYNKTKTMITKPIASLEGTLTDEYFEDEVKKKEAIAEIITAVKTSRRKKVTITEKSNLSINGEFVTLNNYFKVQTGVYKILERNIKKHQNTLLLGPTGVGKTELAYNLAQVMELPITIFDMGTMTDPIMSLVGTHTIKVKSGVTHSEFVKSRFSDAIQEPGIIVLDEISRASAQANNLLFPVLDFRKELSMEYCFSNNKPIKVHPECVFIATANLGSQYTGTHKLDKALIDRFMMIEIEALTHNQIVEIITFTHPKLSNSEVTKLVSCFETINKEHDNFKISFNLSLRHIKIIADLATDGFTLYDGFYAICKGIGGMEGLKTLGTILSSLK